MGVRNILIDLNGCVVGPTLGPMPDGYYEGLRRISKFSELTVKRGSPFLMGACSGREYSYVRGILHMLGSPKGWSICESGLGILQVRPERWETNPALTREIRQAFREITAGRIQGIVDRHDGYVNAYLGNEINVALELAPEAPMPIEEFFTEIRRELRHLEDENLIVMHHSTDTVDISAPGIDKGSGAVQVVQKTGIPLSETLAIGDTNGDAPILTLAGFVGCPSNASKECKTIVQAREGYISPYTYAQGVADIIHHFLEG